MEQYLVWLIATVVSLIVFVPYLMNYMKGKRSMETRRSEAEALGIDKPRAQFPMVDRNLCIGCGACVAACPEGDVLGVVYGAAVIINGERCVGHGYCEVACPVGALKVGMGDITTRPDVPVLSNINETSMPNLFIAGELSGLSLIKNAVSQGKMVVSEIANRPKQHGFDDLCFDVVIVGAGPAGIASALTAIERGLHYLVIDEKEPGGTILHYPRKKLVMTQPVELPLFGWLKEKEYSKEDLMGIWEQVIEQFKLHIVSNQRVESVTKDGDSFVITTPTASYSARHVVLAMGRRGSPRKLDVSGEELPKVTYRLEDAQSYSENRLLVVGGGDSAVEAAVGLAKQPGNRVTISYRKNGFFRIKKKNEDAINRLIQDNKITVLFDSQVTEVRQSSVLLKTRDGVQEIPNDYVFVLIGGVPPFEMLKKMGILFGGEHLQTTASSFSSLVAAGKG
jgi:putative YpdA family bacillithiol system oxidoreductase